MENEFVAAARTLLTEPVELQEIPIQRANCALNLTAMHKGHGKYHTVEYLIYPNNLYLSFPSSAARDQNGNYDSPIFQDNRYNTHKPLWQLMRERIEKELEKHNIRIFFGEYTNDSNGEEFFDVREEPKDSHWLYVKEIDRDTISIRVLTDEDRDRYQNILDELRLSRAIGIVKDRAARDESRACRETSIAYLQNKYHDATDHFTFCEESFKFRQFNIEWLYTSTDIQRFEQFYLESYLPYRLDEMSEEEWRRNSAELSHRLMTDPEFEHDLHMENVFGFQFSLQEDGNCEVVSDLIDTRTGESYHLIVESQNLEEILETVANDLAVVLQRKKQARRATAILQSLSAQF